MKETNYNKKVSQREKIFMHLLVVSLLGSKKNMNHLSQLDTVHRQSHNIYIGTHNLIQTQPVTIFIYMMNYVYNFDIYKIHTYLIFF